MKKMINRSIFSISLSFILVLNSCSVIPIMGESALISNSDEPKEIATHIGLISLAIGIGYLGGTFINHPCVSLNSKKIYMNINEKKELDFIISYPSDRELILIESMDKEIVEVLSRRGRLISAKKKGNTKVFISYGSCKIEMEVVVLDPNIKINS